MRCRAQPAIGRTYAPRASGARSRPHNCGCNRRRMAKPPASDEQLISLFGPHLNYTPPGGWGEESVHPAEKLVKTHCCFCGQQCGIQLKVRHNHVIGFEPWEE